MPTRKNEDINTIQNNDVHRKEYSHSGEAGFFLQKISSRSPQRDQDGKPITAEQSYIDLGVNPEVVRRVKETVADMINVNVSSMQKELIGSVEDNPPRKILDKPYMQEDQESSKPESPTHMPLENPYELKEVKIGDWITTSKDIRCALDDFIDIFNTTCDLSRNEKMEDKERIEKITDSRIKSLAHSGQRSLQKFLDLAKHYSLRGDGTPRDRTVAELRYLVQDFLLDGGEFPKEQKKNTFTNTEVTLITSWMIPFATEGLDIKKRKHISNSFHDHTDDSRERRRITDLSRRTERRNEQEIDTSQKLV